MTIDMAKIKNEDVELWDKSTTQLKTFWEQGPLVLVFLRHYG
ncbi:MAG: hypothetical protein PVJ53_11490 [Desulfobacterales bacterium]|jgi:hypothetical protein